MKKNKIKQLFIKGMAMALSAVITTTSMLPDMALSVQAAYEMDETDEIVCTEAEEPETETAEEEMSPIDEIEEEIILNEETDSFEEVSFEEVSFEESSEEEGEEIEITEEEQMVLATKTGITGSTVVNPGTSSGVFIDKKLKCDGFNLDTKCLDYIRNRYSSDGTNYTYLYGKTSNGQKTVDLVFDTAFTGIGPYAMAHGMFSSIMDYAAKVQDYSPSNTTTAQTQFGYAKGKIMTDTKSVSVETGSNLIHIGEYAFGNMKGCAVFDFRGASGLTTIADNAFYGTNASEYLLPDSITDIGSSSFPTGASNYLVCKKDSKTEDALKKAGYTNIYTYSSLSVTNGSSGSAPTLSGIEKENFTVNFNANGGSCSSTSGVQIYGNPFVLPTPTRTGYTFKGWFTQETGGTQVTGSTIVNYQTEYTTLYAQWNINTYKISIETENCTASMASGTYNYGDSITVSFRPSTGYSMTKITYGNNTSSSSTSVTFKVTEALTVKGYAAANSYLVSVKETGGNGTITGTGTKTYGSAFQVNIKAPTGYKIKEIRKNGNLYSSPAAENATVTGTVGAENIEISVLYEQITFDVTITLKNCSCDQESKTYAYGDTFVAKFTPNTGYAMKSLMVNNVSQDKTDYISFKVMKDTVISAEAVINRYNITGTCLPSAGGTIAGCGNYEYGSSQTVKVTPAKGYKLSEVTIAGNKQIIVDETGQSFSVKVPAEDVALVAAFEKKNYTIKTSGSNVSFQDTTNGVYEFGSTPTFTMTPAEGYKIVEVYIDDENMGAITTYTFEALEANHTIEVKTAVVEKAVYRITKYAEGALITDDVAGVYEEDTTPTFRFKAIPGYLITDVLIDGISKGVISEYTFEKLSGDHSIKVVTKEDPDYVKAGVSILYDHSRGTVVCDRTELEKGTVKISLIPKDGYYVSSVRMDDFSQKLEGLGKEFTLDDLSGNHTIYVVFTENGKEESEDTENIVNEKYHMILTHYLEERGDIIFDANNMLSSEETLTRQAAYKDNTDIAMTISAKSGYYLFAVYVDGKKLPISKEAVSGNLAKVSENSANVSDNEADEKDMTLYEIAEGSYELKMKGIAKDHSVTAIFLTQGESELKECDVPTDSKDVPKEDIKTESVSGNENPGESDKPGVSENQPGSETEEPSVSENEPGVSENRPSVSENKPEDSVSDNDAENGKENQPDDVSDKTIFDKDELGNMVDKTKPIFKIELNLAGGTAKYETISFHEGSSFKLPIPVRYGYQFEGWYVSGRKITTTAEIVSEAEHVMAMWSVAEYKIQYQLNNGYFRNEAKVHHIYRITKSCSLQKPTRIGYVFAGWYLKDTEIKVTKLNKGTYYGGNITLEARWYAKSSSKYCIPVSGKTSGTITYILNGGSYRDSMKVTYNYDAAYTKVSLPKPVRLGYKFEGWYIKGTEIKLTRIAKHQYLGNVELEARWSKPIYTMTYQKNKGKGVMDKTSTSFDEKAVISDIGYVRPGYVFAGWNTKANGTGLQYAPGQTVSNITTKTNINLYAQWRRVF